MLVDTSVWIDHVRRADPRLIALLEDNDVDVHPFVIGELACGSLRKRDELTELLQQLPSLPTVDHEEAVLFVERHRLERRHIGWIDVHLLASAALAHATLWTRDTQLAVVARELGITLYG